MSTWKRSGGVNALTRLYKACASKPQAVQTPCSNANNCDRDAWELFACVICAPTRTPNHKKNRPALLRAAASRTRGTLVYRPRHRLTRGPLPRPRDAAVVALVVRRWRLLLLSSTSSASSSNSSPAKVWRSTARKERHAATNFLLLARRRRHLTPGRPPTRQQLTFTINKNGGIKGVHESREWSAFP